MIAKQLTLSLRFSFFIGSIFTTLVAGMMVALEWPLGVAGPVWLVALNKVFAEMLLIIALSLLLFSPLKLLRLASSLLVLLYSLVLYTQITSLQFSSKYLPPVALENAQHADFLLDTGKIGWFIIILLAFINTAGVVKARVNPVPTIKGRAIIALCLILASVMIKNDSRWLSEQLISQRYDFYNSGRASIEHKAPGSAMVETLKAYFQSFARLRSIAKASVELPKDSAVFAYNHGIKINETSGKFPLLKPISFAKSPTFIPKEGWQQKNMIVFFVEGMSSRIIQPYTEYFPGISPHLEDFSKQSLVVNDYFNHSFATYRALSGQLCSIYANGVLRPDINYYCLPHVLAENGYDTHFFVSQSLAKTNLDDLANHAGFANVYGSKELVQYIPDTPELDYGLEDFILFDQNFVESFKRWMKQKEGQSDAPFFAALYNFQTHTGVRLNSDLKYSDPTGKSESYVLDTFHNFDKAFGVFWEYFKASPYYDDTIVVVTTDHATFGSKDFSELVRHTQDYAPVFADQIPLMIYHPQGRPQTFSARDASSINFAPSIMHTLNVTSDAAPFVGNTIFDINNTYPKPMVVSSGVSYLNVGGAAWLRQLSDRQVEVPSNAPEAKLFHDLIMYTQDLERQNRLIPPSSE